MSAPKPDVKTIFGHALEIDALDERAAYLDQACGPDSTLRAEVETLLGALNEAADFMSRPAAAQAGIVAHGTVDERPGTMIGPYRLIEEIGAGGMGVVFVAEQQEPVHRQVALKVIKPGMDSREVMARFEAERRTLALMDHPNIATILDAGMTGEVASGQSAVGSQEKRPSSLPAAERRLSTGGRPYFVMELVRGVPITKFCDDHALTPRQRLELCIPVCQAVQHAHQKGIIHRDLTPGNILVTLFDDKPTPKVIDFGIAKAVDAQRADKTSHTSFGQRVGTPLYMSPEQAGTAGLDIDTRSDIYSLGVLLYELLTGTTPFDREGLRQAAYDDVLRIIREEEPPNPSTRITELSKAGESGSGEPSPTGGISGPARLAGASLSKLVRGDLDWIVMKCLEKDRARRYQTANELAMELQRYLADEPVLAGPPSTTYRLRKFVKRNRGPVLAACLLLTTLVGGVVGTTLGLIRAVHAQQAEAEQRKLAQDNERKALVAVAAEQQAKTDAESSEADTQAVLEFVESKIFAAMRPPFNGGLGPDVTLRRAIEEVVPFVEKSFKQQPLVEARLRRTIGVSYFVTLEPKLAVKQLEAARAIYVAHRGADHHDTIVTMHQLASAYTFLDRHVEAAALNEQALALRQAKLGLDHRDTLFSMNRVADSYLSLGRGDEAVALREKRLAVLKAQLGRDHADTFTSMRDLAWNYESLKRHKEALALRAELLSLQRTKFGADHQETLATMVHLASTYELAGQRNDAIKLLEERVALLKAKLGSDDREMHTAMNSLAQLCDAAGRRLDALKLREEVVMLREKMVARHKVKDGPAHPDTLRAMLVLAEGYAVLNRHVEAFKVREERLALQKAHLGADHPDTMTAMDELARKYSDDGRHADAVRLHEEIVEVCKTKQGLEDMATLQGMHKLARAYFSMGRRGDAVKLHEETLSLQKAKFGADHPQTIVNMVELADKYNSVGRAADAAKLNEEVLTLQTAKLGPEHLDTLRSKERLANHYSANGKHAAALKFHQETLAVRRKALGPDAPDTLKSMWGVAYNLEKLERGNEALPIIDDCLRRAAGRAVDPEMIPRLMTVRMRHFAKSNDVAGCRETAEMWEQLKRTDANSYYQAAWMRAVTAGVIRASDPSERSAQEAAREADRAMACLKKAVAAGFGNVAQVKRSRDLDVLRGRDDFQELVAGLEARPGKK